MKSVLFALFAAVAIFICYERIMMSEELRLERAYGEQYRRWATRTPMFLPRLRHRNAAGLVFSWRAALAREHGCLLFVGSGFFAVELLEATLLESHGVRQWAAAEPIWTALLIAGLATSLGALAVRRNARRLAAQPPSPSAATPPSAPGRSYQMTASQFDTPAAAGRYATRHGHSRDRREQATILRALSGIPPGASVLDLPSGTGRLLPMLHRLGYRITEADYSAHMIKHAREFWRHFVRTTADAADTAVAFDVQDVMSTSYANDAFDVVICNRLFHHFSESATRVLAFGELRRISRGPIIVSFFDAAALDAKARAVMNRIRRRVPRARRPIPMAAFLADARAAGLVANGTFRTRGCISPQTYVRLVRA
jgi:SAM-dependent methyltransferase/protein-S-isoprenylcysteine O-methyltransferase Ste14